jgi:hypothetical protein
LAILFSTSQGMTVQIKGLRTQVDPHYSRGISSVDRKEKK